MRSYALICTLAFTASTLFSSPASAQLMNPWSELESKGIDEYTPSVYSNDLGDSDLASYMPEILLAILLSLSHGSGPSVGGAAIVDPGLPRDAGGSSTTNPGSGASTPGDGSGSGSAGSGTGSGSTGTGSAGSGSTGSGSSGGTGDTGGAGGTGGPGGTGDPGGQGSTPPSISAVPEPSSYALLVGLGTGVAFLVNRKRQMVRR